MAFLIVVVIVVVVITTSIVIVIIIVVSTGIIIIIIVVVIIFSVAPAAGGSACYKENDWLNEATRCSRLRGRCRGGAPSSHVLHSAQTRLPATSRAKTRTCDSFMAAVV